MKRRLLIALASLLALLTLAFAALALWASRPVAAPYPDVAADRSPEGVERGRALFEGTCGACHVGPGSGRAAGTTMTDVPSFIGTLRARNLTRDGTTGIGRMPDRAIARLLRFGVTHDGRAAAMPTYGFSDEDLASVLGFLRSDDPLFVADPSPSPSSDVSLIGSILIRAGLADASSRPTRGLRAPPRGPTVAYGRYLAHDVYDCAGCHTPGFSPDKTSSPELLRGGFEFATPDGGSVRAPNLTRDATGLGDWSVVDLDRALRLAVKPDGRPMRAPMPRFGRMSEEDVAALFAYLRSVPPGPGEVAATRVHTAARSATGGETPQPR